LFAFYALCVTGLCQGCHIFLDTIDKNGEKCTKLQQNYQMTIKCTKRPHGIKYINIFHSKALQNLPKSGFWFDNIPSGNPGLCFCKGKKEVNDWNIILI
jgi:hypothetical protein